MPVRIGRDRGNWNGRQRWAYLADRASVHAHAGQSILPWQLIVPVPQCGQSSAPGVAALIVAVAMDRVVPIDRDVVVVVGAVVVVWALVVL